MVLTKNATDDVFLLVVIKNHFPNMIANDPGKLPLLQSFK